MVFTKPIINYLQRIKIPLRLACVTQEGWPLVLSLWYLYEDGALYCATQASSKVVGYLENEPRCGFEVASDQPPYCGVRGPAVVKLEADRGLEILERLLVRYLGDTDNPLGRKLLSRTTPEVALRLEPQSIYTWDFTPRMKATVEVPEVKPCP